VGFFFRK